MEKNGSYQLALDEVLSSLSRPVQMLGSLLISMQPKPLLYSSGDWRELQELRLTNKFLCMLRRNCSLKGHLVIIASERAPSCTLQCAFVVVRATADEAFRHLLSCCAISPSPPTENCFCGSPPFLWPLQSLPLALLCCNFIAEHTSAWPMGQNGEPLLCFLNLYSYINLH